MDDPMLTRLLTETADAVEPTDRLGEIRRATAAPLRRRRWYAAGGAALATAAVVATVAVAVRPSPDPEPAPGSQPPVVDSATPGLGSQPVYYVSDTPQGPRLFREFQQTTPLGDDLLRLVESAPDDPDYRTSWAPGSFGAVRLREDLGQIDVTLADASLRDRPEGMSAADATLAVQQVIYTVQGVLQQRLPVQFRLHGNRVDQVVGVPTSEPLAQAPQLDVLATMSISNPAEGRTVHGSFTADGVASSFEGTVHWRLLGLSGSQVTPVREGTAQGSMGDYLTPWATGRIDVSDLAPGSYVFEASTDDPSMGESGGPVTDTRTVVVQ